MLRNPISAIGAALTTASAFLFLFLVALQLVGFLQNPYAGIVVFVLVPALFTVGLLLIPIGLWLERRRIRAEGSAPVWSKIDLTDPAVRRTPTLLFVAVATLANIVILSMASYGAVQYTGSQQFCGQVCHAIMEPEFVAHQNGPHGRVPCVTCHVGPGAGGFVAAKLNGTRQLWLAVSGTHNRPIPTPLENMPDVRTSCEQCHWPDRFVGDTIKVVYEHADDEANTQTKTTLRLHVGGPVSGTGSGTGIHWHMNRANEIEYVALDEQRERIPYVRVATPDGTVREYFADGVTQSDLAGKARRRMDCLDCHNRPAHRFGSSPERAVDAAIGEGLINAKIPFIRSEAVRALRAEYASQEAALMQIERTIRESMNSRLPPPPPFGDADIRQAVGVAQGVYRNNVFPSMKVGWGTYPNQVGHTISTGCFRCHDDSHKTRDGVAIRQECDLCHAIE